MAPHSTRAFVIYNGPQKTAATFMCKYAFKETEGGSKGAYEGNATIPRGIGLGVCRSDGLV